MNQPIKPKNQTLVGKSTKNNLVPSKISLLWMLACLATIGLGGTSLALAEEILEIPEMAPATTAPAEPLPETNYIEPPAESQWQPEPEPVPYTEVPAPVEDNYVPPPASEPSWQPEPEPYATEPEYLPPQDTYTAEPEPLFLPENPEIALPPVNLPEPSGSEATSNDYIDRTSYQVGATESDSPSVVFSERKSGCEAILQSGQAVPGSLCDPGAGQVADTTGNWTPPSAVAGGQYGSEQGQANAAHESLPANIYGQPVDAYGQPIAVDQYRGNQDRFNQVAERNNNNESVESGYYESSNQNYYSNESESYYSNSGGSNYNSGSGGLPELAAVVVGSLDIGPMSSSGMSYYNRTQRPNRVLGNGNTGLLFPLAIPAPITSLFGWREHPVLGYGKFHTGVDLGAPIGTPVVAAYAGKVAIADWLGGYGVTVVLEHSPMKRETLYGHLSELFVKPGEWVEQGEVIGRVGSTGMSTGPHLHFESRKLEKEGWIAEDPNQQMQLSLAQLMKTLQGGKLLALPKISPQMLAQLTKDAEGAPKLPPLPPGFDVTIPNLAPPFSLYPQNADLARADNQDQ